VKALIVGTSGIGARHAANIRSLHPDATLIGVRATPSEAITKLEMLLVPDLSAGVSERPDFAVVALPPALHANAAGLLLDANVPLYLEKPPALHAGELEKRVHNAEARGLVTMTGCVLRRMPGFCRLRELIRSGEYGTPLHARLSVGQWLPDWRPGRDYRETYSARRELGGGVLRDLVHEFDLARFLFGGFDAVTATARNTGTLEINTEDVADVLLRRPDMTANIHLDYLDRTHHREGRVILTSGTATYDALAGRLAVYRSASPTPEEMGGEDAFSVPLALKDAMAHFIECVIRSRPSDQPISDGLVSLSLADRARADAGIPA
jgi:predicted dehydrogenase